MTLYRSVAVLATVVLAASSTDNSCQQQNQGSSGSAGSVSIHVSLSCHGSGIVIRTYGGGWKRGRTVQFTYTLNGPGYDNAVRHDYVSGAQLVDDGHNYYGYGPSRHGSGDYHVHVDAYQAGNSDSDSATCPNSNPGK